MANAFREKMMAEAAGPVALLPSRQAAHLRTVREAARRVVAPITIVLRAAGWRYEADVCHKGWRHPLVIGRHTATQAARIVLPVGCMRVE